MVEQSEPVVEFESVNSRLGAEWALHDVSFALRAGEIRIVLGAAGSGKTTLLKAAIGVVQPDSGSISLFGEEVTTGKEHDLFALRAKAGVLFQEGGLFD